MTPNTRIIIENRIVSDGEYKKYRSNQEQLEQNQRDKEVQRQRDERARNESSNRNGNTAQDGPLESRNGIISPG